MLVRKGASFNFRNARWDSLKLNYKEYASLLAAGADDDQAAQDRYTQLMETQPAVLACFFNLATALSQIHFADRGLLDFIRELIWEDKSMTQDRFFAWAEAGMIDRVTKASAQGSFAPSRVHLFFTGAPPEAGRGGQFGEASIQLTFHENDNEPSTALPA